MNTQIAILLAAFCCAYAPIRAEEATGFPKCDGISTKGLFVDLNDDPGGRVFVSYHVHSDSGAEVVRCSKDGTVIWRTSVAPLMIEHSAYRQDTLTWIQGDELYIKIDGNKTITEVIDIKTGKKISRKVTERQR